MDLMTSYSGRTGLAGASIAEADPVALLTLPAFGPEVHLMTTEGELPVEWLATGDRVITRDHGAQKILWIGRLRMTARWLSQDASLGPIGMGPGALGPRLPGHATALGPATRLLVTGAQLELQTGLTEALAAIGDLADGRLVRPERTGASVHYTFLLLQMHELVLANGMWCECVALSPMARAILGDALPEEIAARQDVTDGHLRDVRPGLAPWEVTALRGPDPARSLPTLIARAA